MLIDSLNLSDVNIAPLVPQKVRDDLNQHPLLEINECIFSVSESEMGVLVHLEGSIPYLFSDSVSGKEVRAHLIIRKAKPGRFDIRLQRLFIREFNLDLPS